MCRCNHCGESTTRTGPRFRPISLLFQVAFAWLVLVLAGGTLKNAGHPVAIEAGRLIQTVTFVDPAIEWADRRGLQTIAGGLRVVAGGIPLGGSAAHGTA